MFKKRNKKKSTINTFTKIWVDRNLKLSWVCIFLCFGLAYLGKSDIAETLACTIVVNIVGVFVGYFAKSFFETKEEKKNELQEKLNLGIVHTKDEEYEESLSDETEDPNFDVEDADI